MPEILFITSRFPFPLTKGDRLRVYYQIKYLSATHDIYLVAINDHPVPDNHLQELKPYCKEIFLFNIPLYSRIISLVKSLFTKLPLQVAFFYNPEVQRKIEQLIDKLKPDYIHCHLIRTSEYVRNIAGYRKSLDFMDAFGKGMERRELKERNPVKRLLFSYEKKRLYAYEQQVFTFIDKFCIISEQDKQLIPSPRSGEIAVIPNGVDLEEFYPRTEKKVYDILFMGNMGYPPNILAVEYIASQVLPFLKEAKPDIRFLIAGVNPPRSIKQLQSDNTDVIENFNHISDSIAMSRIMLAPMIISIGLQNKILQAMAMKVPCIVSTMANKAVRAKHQEEIIEAGTPQEFASGVLELLSDEHKASAIANKGYDYIISHFTWQKQNELLTRLFE